MDESFHLALLGQCRSLALRIFQFALDEGAIDTNPVRKVPAPKRRADPDLVLRPGKRRALTPEEAGQLLACFPLFWWDHVITLLGTGLRIGELAGLHRRRLPPGNDPAALLFTGPGSGPGQRGGPGVKKGTRTMLSRHNFRRTYHSALATLANPATAGLRPTATRVLGTLRDHSPLTAEQLATRLSTQGRTARVVAIDRALAELAAAGAAAVDPQTRRWTLLPGARHPLLEAVDLHGAHDLRHIFATWLEDAGIPARVIDELMVHIGGRRNGGTGGSPMGRVYRETTPAMLARVTAALDERIGRAMEVVRSPLRDAEGSAGAQAG